jgi:hypothetical protein
VGSDNGVFDLPACAVHELIDIGRLFQDFFQFATIKPNAFTALYTDIHHHWWNRYLLQNTTTAGAIHVLISTETTGFENKSIVTGTRLKSNHLSRLSQFPDPDQSR